MRRWVSRYHAYLVREVEGTGVSAWWFAARPLMAPWIIPLLVSGVAYAALGGGGLFAVMLLSVGFVVSLGGTIYVAAVVMRTGRRAERRARDTEASRK